MENFIGEENKTIKWGEVGIMYASAVASAILIGLPAKKLIGVKSESTLKVFMILIAAALLGLYVSKYFIDKNKNRVTVN